MPEPMPEAVTEPVPEVGVAGEPIQDVDLLHPEDLDDEWPVEAPKRGLRLRIPTAALVGLLILAGGFWGGAVAEKHHSGSSGGTSSLAAALAQRFGANGATGGTGRAGTGTGAAAGGFLGGAGGGSATAGIVTGVQGNTLYVTDASGNLVKVTVGPSVSVTRTASTPLAGLQTGDTVVVSGTKAANGTITATAVRDVAKGTSVGGGGGTGGAGGGFGGAGGGTGGAGGG
jgi:hypothetical protein